MDNKDRKEHEKRILNLAKLQDSIVTHMIDQGIDETTFECPLCGAAAHIYLDKRWGYYSYCETPGCFKSRQ
ncbi:hypothetical protein AN477_13755 [Alicyclobacillus ferrooxydans]|uniref:Uncharacterized protein n=1 Tax=Alicyclobacillus ferrooxydans TaxID=471514 RepID=A0A0P9CCD2_9BACL|nr:hypothetical protein AN477_13755 [Alicyclobacillus ferrooxydans]